MEKLFSYPLGPVPWSLATGDRMLAKTDKATLMHKLEVEDKVIPGTQSDISNEDIFISDGNVLLHSLDSISETFGQLARIGD